jgi:16S rRNA (uracil1498-N3)-methyltransferase
MAIVRRIHLPRAQLAPALAESGALVSLTADQSRYLVSVLRLESGEQLEVFDGEGARYAATLRAGSGATGEASVELGKQLPNTTNSGALEVTLAQALAKADKLELVIQKATELGCARVIPFAAERSIVKLDKVSDERGQAKVVRWRKIAEEAARQSGRAEVPEIVAPVGWTELFAWLAQDPELRAIALDPLATLRLGAAALGAKKLLIAVGPEGGFSPEELERAEANGFVRASLGSLVLRTETAGLAALAVVQHLAGTLG